MAVQCFAILEFDQHRVALGGCEKSERELHIDRQSPDL
jgi:hypothetical protein